MMWHARRANCPLRRLPKSAARPRDYRCRIAPVTSAVIATGCEFESYEKSCKSQAQRQAGVLAADVAPGGSGGLVRPCYAVRLVVLTRLPTTSIGRAGLSQGPHVAMSWARTGQASPWHARHAVARPGSVPPLPRSRVAAARRDSNRRASSTGGPTGRGDRRGGYGFDHIRRIVSSTPKPPGQAGLRRLAWYIRIGPRSLRTGAARMRRVGICKWPCGAFLRIQR